MAHRPLAATLALLVLLAGCTKPGGLPTTPKAHASTPVEVSATASASPLVKLNGPLSPLKPVATPAPSPGATPGPAALAGMLSLTAALVKTAGGIISDNGGGVLPDRASGLISDNGGGLITDNGGALITDNGGAVISNNGGSFKLLGLDAQIPVQNGLVVLADASGRPLAGPDGKPLTAKTDAQGHFAFAGALPADNLLAAVDLGPAGVALATVIKGQASGLSLDVASTLEAAYILDKYVASQALDHQVVLDRLTAEADTAARAATLAALQGAITVPAGLARAQAVQAEEDLRKQDTRLDAQLEVVRKLLVVAGQLDEGNGQLATNVALRPHRLDVDAAGNLFIYDWNEYRIFKVAGGKLSVLAGTGKETNYKQDTLVAGMKATDAPFDNPSTCLDAMGRFCFEAEDAVWRIEADGTLARLASLAHTDAEGHLHEAPNGEIWRYSDTTDYKHHALDAIGADGKLRSLATWTTPDYIDDVVPASDGNGAWVFVNGQRQRLLLPGGTFGPAESLGVAGLNDGSNLWAYDDTGTLYWTHEGKEAGPGFITARAPGSTTDVEAIAARGDATENPEVVRGQDGKLYAFDERCVYRVDAGKLVRVAGTAQGGTVGGDATAIALDQPAGIAATGVGVFYVADDGDHRIVKYAPGQPVTALTDPRFDPISACHAGPNGDIYLSTGNNSHAGGVFRFVGGAGTATQVMEVGELYADQPAAGLRDFAVQADGAIYYAHPTDAGAEVGKFAGGKYAKVADVPGGDTDPLLANGPAGALFLCTSDGIAYRLDGAAFTKLGTFKDPQGKGSLDVGGFAVDAQGRFYAAVTFSAKGGDDLGHVLRLDPATQATVLVAGPGAPNLAGSKPDDGLAAGPGGLAFDPDGNLYISDSGHQQVKQIAKGKALAGGATVSIILSIRFHY